MLFKRSFDVRLVQDELDGGHTFLFEVNNIRIFCGGKRPLLPPLPN